MSSDRTSVPDLQLYTSPSL